MGKTFVSVLLYRIQVGLWKLLLFFLVFVRVYIVGASRFLRCSFVN